MKKTIFIMALALSMPLVAQARGAKAKPFTIVGKAFKANQSVKDVDLLKVTGLCGASCAQKIGAMTSQLGVQTKAVLVKLQNMSLGKAGRGMVAAALIAVPGIAVQANTFEGSSDGLTGAMLNASAQSGSWDAQSRNTLASFTNGVAKDGVEIAVKNTFGITERNEVNKKVEEIKENCKI